MKCKNCGEPIHQATMDDIGTRDHYDTLIGSWIHNNGYFTCHKSSASGKFAECDELVIVDPKTQWEDGSPVHTDDDLIQAYSRQFDNGV